MWVTRVLDLTALLLLAVAILLPRPDAKAKAASNLDDGARARVAELQVQLQNEPGALAPSLELADLFLDAHRPDWTLAVVSPALDRYPSDHRLQARRALALADHFEGGTAFQAASRALALCEAGSSAPCGGGERARLTLLRDTLEKVQFLDMRRDPNTAKERILRALRPAYLPRPRRSPGAPVPAPDGPASSASPRAP